MKRLGHLLLAVSAVLALALGVVLVCVHPRFLLGTLSGDDAGYYLAIARNFALGHGASFDRVEPTNGFNPLLTVLLIALDRLFAPGLGLVACFRIGMLVTWAAVVAGSVALLLLTRRVLLAHGLPEDARTLALGAVAFWLAAFVAPKGYYGIDAFLVLATGGAYLTGVAAHGLLARGAWHAVRDGALLALVVLARVDSLPLAAAAFAGMARTVGGEPGRGRAALARAAVFAAGVAPYLVWNRLAFGDWLPISARLKSSFPALDLGSSLRTVFGTSLNPADEAVLVLTLVASLVWLVPELRAGRRDGPAGAPGAHDAMAVLALALAARLTWLLLFSRLDVQGSYFILAPPFLALAAIAAASRAGGRRGTVVVAVALVCATTVLFAAKLATSVRTVRAISAGEGDEWAIGRRVHETVPEGSIVYGGAFGLLGFISDRPWINGDGVANGREYQRAIAAGRLSRYLRERSVDVIALGVAAPAAPEDGSFMLTAESYLHAARDSIEVHPRGILLRERLRRSGGSYLWLVRWPASAGAQVDEVPSSDGQPSR